MVLGKIGFEEAAGGSSGEGGNDGIGEMIPTKYFYYHVLYDYLFLP